MIVGVADTHAVIWYLNADKRLSGPAKQFIDDTAQRGDEIGVSPITLIEMVYLIEKSKIPVETLAHVIDEPQDPGRVFIEVPLDLKVVRIFPQINRTSIPEMPDRIIAATALSLNVPVISRDAKIQTANLQTIW